jgi:uncharacterized protein YbjT (DUF2867 family)
VIFGDDEMVMDKKILVLVTGATGYVGNRLVPRLLEEGYSVRVLVRDPKLLAGKSWLPDVHVVQGDVLKPETLPQALESTQFAYYLIHSMLSADDFPSRDLDAATNFGAAAKEAGTQRIIYLGGLGDPKSNLSTHLRSRQKTGDKLRESGVLVTEFRAGIIIGSGSASFEMIRYLTERLPILISPRWVLTRGQPLAINDVLNYLVQSIKIPTSAGKIIEIGGSDILTYGQMMIGYAKARGLRRYIIPVPILTSLLTSRVHWVTPIPPEIARPLTEGLRNEVIVQPVGYKDAVEKALDDLRPQYIESTQISPVYTQHEDNFRVQHQNLEGMISETRQLKVNAKPESVYQVFTSLGGQNGWLFANRLWQLRGILDQAVGGVGLRRGRRHPKDLRLDDPLDFYRVEALEPNKMMRLRAEMKLPGKAWMQYTVLPEEDGTSQLTQIAYFAPRGLLGQIYWYVLYPIHSIVFSGLIRAICTRAESA